MSTKVCSECGDVDGGPAVKKQELITPWMWVPILMIILAVAANIPFIEHPFAKGLWYIFGCPNARQAWGWLLGVGVGSVLFLADIFVVIDLFSEGPWVRIRRYDHSNYEEGRRRYWKNTATLPWVRKSAHPRRDCWIFLAAQLLILIWGVGWL